MKIGGLQKHTLIDYPGKLAATIFVSGCNFKCPFCHNPELVLPERIKKNHQIPLKEIWDFLKERKGFLDAVVICGGEPTIHHDLDDFCKRIKKIGYEIKIDTNGYDPELLESLIKRKLVDYIAMDIKAPKKNYKRVVSTNIDLERIEKSIKLLKRELVDYEFRTTLVPNLVEKKDILKIVEWISPAKRYFLQNFSDRQETIDKSFSKKKSFEHNYLEDIKKEVGEFFDVCKIR